MYIKYLSKWSRMPWWSHMTLLRKRNQLLHDDVYQMVSVELPSLMPKLDVWAASRPKPRKEETKLTDVVDRFFKKFPELKIHYIGDSTSVNMRKNDILKYIYIFKELKKKGFSDDAAYDEMVRIHGDNIKVRQDSMRIANGVRSNNGFRNLWDYYQQNAEYEARLKVQRMQRDVLMNEFLDKKDLPDFDRNVMVTNLTTRFGPSEKKTFDQFFDRAQELLKMYYQAAFTRDRLSGLTDNEILTTLKESPTKIKKACRDVLSKVDKYQIKINPDGSLDLSKVQSERTKETLRNNPYLKYAIMQRDVSYGFTHQTNRPKVGEQLKKDLLQTRSEDKIREEEETREERELELRKQASQSEIDKIVGFTSGGGFARTRGDGGAGSRYSEPKDLIQGSQYRLDENGLLIESFPERLLRLEKKWLLNRLSNLGSGVEGLSENEVSAKLQNVTDKIRRVKLLIEKNAMTNATDRIFEEHQELSMEELTSEQTPIERLLNYYSLPVDQRQPGLAEDLEFGKIKKLVRRKELIEDLVAPFDDTFRSQLTLADTYEAQIAEMNTEVVEHAGSEDEGLEDIDYETAQANKDDEMGDMLTSQKLDKIRARKVKQGKKEENIFMKMRDRVNYGQNVRKSLGIQTEEDEGEDMAVKETPARVTWRDRNKIKHERKAKAKEDRRKSKR